MKNIVWFAILICLPLILIGCNKSIDKNDTISSADNKIPELIYESEYQSDSEHFQVYQTGSVNSSDEDMCYENVIFDFETISPEDAQNFHRLEEGYTYIRISDIDCYYLESYKDQPNKTTFNCIAITDKCEKYFFFF